MATTTKKKDKWYVQIRRSFHKPIYKSFIAKSYDQRWSRETERSIEVGEFLDTTEENKTTLSLLSLSSAMSKLEIRDKTL